VTIVRGVVDPQPLGPHDSVGLVDAAPMIYVYDRDHPRLIVDPVNDPVTATASSVPIIKRRKQTSAHTVRIVQQRPR
jgi:hypothetical protein